MRKICVVTGTRAEYGLLYWTLNKLQNDNFFRLQICVTGMHLSPEFGMTYKKIEDDGFKIDYKVESLLSSDSSQGISKSIGIGINGFSDAFEYLKPDIILVLGDRYEVLSAVISAMCHQIPVAHCHGGEATEGLMDESIRHSITKMSHLHFTSTDEYRNRVIQLGESPKTVFNYGALGIENIYRLKLLNKKQFEVILGRRLSKINIIVTFHPVTLENNTSKTNFKNILNAIDEFEDMFIIFTYPNSDKNGRIISKMIDKYVNKNSLKSRAYLSMGQLNYLSALKYVDLVIGNSSSGLIEAPSFKTPTINIGDRQRGRIMPESVISCGTSKKEIVKSIVKGLSVEFKNEISSIKNPYEHKNTSNKIASKLKSINIDNLLKKKFHNIDLK